MLQLGNGRWESTQFNSRLQPIQIALGVVQNATDLLKLDFSYGTTNNNGNVQSQTITVPTIGSTNGFTATQIYQYDSLNRLKSAEETISSQQTWKQTFTYDRYGNRNFDESTTTTLPKNCGTSPNFTVCTADKKILNPSISATNNRIIQDQDADQQNDYLFDSSGNTTKDAQDRTFIYDAENKQIEVKDSQSQTIGEYFYDGDGKRVKKIVPATGETTIFVYDAGGKLVAEYSTVIASQQDAKVSYLTNDHLGSPRINTDANGNVTARHDYQPFGEEIQRASYGADAVRKQFATYERDKEINLDFAQARYFDSGFGRFSSPDPYGGSGFVGIPQSWNRYSYCLNRPYVFIDPSGMIWLTNDGGNNYIWVDDKYYEKNKSKYDGYDVANGAVIKLGGTIGFGNKYNDLVGSYVSLNADGTLSAAAVPAVVEINMGDPDEPPKDEVELTPFIASVNNRPSDELRGPPGGHRRFGTTFRIYDSDGYALLDLDTHPGHEDLGDPHAHWWTWGNNREWWNRSGPKVAPDGTTEIGKDENGDPIYDPFGRRSLPSTVPVVPDLTPARPMPIRPGIPIRPLFPIRVPVFVP